MFSAAAVLHKSTAQYLNETDMSIFHVLFRAAETVSSTVYTDKTNYFVYSFPAAHKVALVSDRGTVLYITRKNFEKFSPFNTKQPLRKFVRFFDIGPNALCMLMVFVSGLPLLNESGCKQSILPVHYKAR